MLPSTVPYCNVLLEIMSCTDGKAKYMYQLWILLRIYSGLIVPTLDVINSLSRKVTWLLYSSTVVFRCWTYWRRLSSSFSMSLFAWIVWLNAANPIITISFAAMMQITVTLKLILYKELNMCAYECKYHYDYRYRIHYPNS